MDHNTPVLASLHWPPVNLRIQYKVLLVGPLLHSRHALHTYCIPFRSVTQFLLTVPQSRISQKGDHASAVAFANG